MFVIIFFLLSDSIIGIKGINVGERHNFYLYEMYSPVEITKLIIYKMHL